MLSAFIPFFLEVVVAYFISSWSFLHRSSSIFARAIFEGLFISTLTLSTELALSGDGPHLTVDDVDELAQRMVMRGVTQLMGTMVIALTFGIAVPALGATCAVAALVQLVHHKFALGRVVAVGMAAPQHSPPDLKQCTTLPWSCCAVISVTVLSFWLLFCIKNPSIDPKAFAGGAASAIALCVLSTVIFQLQGKCSLNRDARFRALSTVSTTGVNMEPLLNRQGEDFLWEGGLSDQDSNVSSIPSCEK